MAEKYDVKFKKKFGQNFLKNIDIVDKIVDADTNREFAGVKVTARR